MCGLGEEQQQADPDSSVKGQCKGCGAKYFDKTRVGNE